ncbi:TonB-dependent receptor [Novosphingobium sp.]|uniref:TonB-dependent receptor n=1 Tax=Novosphingobium sp. TaxID=1874826 RepID=UPI0022BF3FF3|nr:TonB-dependent receptor [Novosphingobium sp.]MCZ8019479.1 TonB-dependent receptor [Novosphingobium sp.]MCZ8035294.1 TonB-dependent receptor [Novosphingobium sp.]MCZ8050608.1 TonB-dependent receptor [Novosphingobium sp.]MCZ8058954.1 TonB-dependent receptor [Novosphingobium sp.]MCZ8232399.1 TonB-dependent receptor [Novosphingobium sp.]
MTRTALLSAVSLAAMLASPAYAQNTPTDDQGLEDIVVTAQRRAESVQDVPIAITAFNAETLETRGINTALDVTQFVPNLVGLNNTGLGTANSYYLRGVGNTESIATFDPPIGTYINDVYISRQNANNFSFFDVERVEVLRGPQGTLFGRNTTGGAIAVVMKDPGDEIGGYIEAGYGSYQRKLARGSIDLPVSPQFAIKLSGYWQNDNGYAKNTTTGERTNENDGWGLRLGVKGELSDSITWRASYMHTYADASNVANFDCDPANPTNCDGRFVTTGLRKVNDFGGRFTGRKDDFGLGNQAEMDMITSNLEFGLGGDTKLNLITGYLDMRQTFALDFADGRALPSLAVPSPAVRGYTLGGFVIANDGKHKQFTQEVKLSGSLGDGLVDYVTGVFYINEKNDTDFADLFNLGLAPPPAGFPFLLADRRLKNNTKAWAGYAQADINVSDALTLTAGIRYTDEEKTFDISDNRASCNDGTVEATCLVNANLRATNGVAIPTVIRTKVWTPRFALNYKMNDDVLMFLSATKGFKSGGWNARATAPSEALPFGPETAWSYEAGVKADLLDNRLRVNLTGFLLDIEGLQTPSAFTRANGSIAFITRNFANYRNKGVELEVTARPADGFTVFGSIGYMDDEYRLDPNAPAFDLYGVQAVAGQLAACATQLAAGRTPVGSGADNATACGVGIVAPDGSLAEPVRSPAWTMAFGASYEAQLGGGMTLTPAVNASWRADSETGTSGVSFYSQPYTSPGGTAYGGNLRGLGNFVTGSFSESRWIANASLTLKSESGWSLVAECKNCFDQEAVESTLANVLYLNPPRTWTLRAKFDF